MFYNGSCSGFGEENPRCSELVRKIAWYDGNAGEGPRPVAQKKPNDFGLYDMSGNVQEWVWDQYLPVPRQDEVFIDPVIPESDRGRAEVSSIFRVLRGGSYVDEADKLRAAARAEGGAGGYYEHSGVRVVKTADCD